MYLHIEFEDGSNPYFFRERIPDKPRKPIACGSWTDGNETILLLG